MYLNTVLSIPAHTRADQNSPFALSLRAVPGHFHVRIRAILVLLARQRRAGLGERRPQPVEQLLLFALVNDGDIVDDEDVVESVERGDGVPEGR